MFCALFFGCRHKNFRESKPRREVRRSAEKTDIRVRQASVRDSEGLKAAKAVGEARVRRCSMLPMVGKRM